MFRGAKALPDLQQAVLIATKAIGPADAKAIRRYVAQKTGSRVILSTIYRTLDRLQGKGWVGLIAEHHMRHGREIRPYGSRYQVTRAGEQALRVHMRRIERLWSDLKPVPPDRPDPR